MRKRMADSSLVVLLSWIAISSCVAFLIMGVDKLLARSGSSRISERAIWTTAFVGGFPGVFLGGRTFHHKTSKAGFWPPVYIAAVVWIAVLVMVFR